MVTTITSVTFLAKEIQSETLCNQSQRPLIAGIKQEACKAGKNWSRLTSVHRLPAPIDGLRTRIGLRRLSSVHFLGGIVFSRSTFKSCSRRILSPKGNFGRELPENLRPPPNSKVCTRKRQLQTSFSFHDPSADQVRAVRNCDSKDHSPAIDPSTPTAIVPAIDPGTTTTPITVDPPTAAAVAVAASVDPSTAVTTPAVDPDASFCLWWRGKPGASKYRRRDCRTRPFPQALEEQPPPH